MKFRTLTRKFPITTDRLSISVLGKRDMSAYIKELTKPYFIEYLDNKNIVNMSNTEIKTKLGSLIATYQMPINFIYEYRLVIKLKNTNEICGGITINPINTNKIFEVAYWVKPEYQGNGIATEALKRIIEFMRESIKELEVITLEIQEVNIASIKIAEKCGFGQRSISRGAYYNNVEYSLIWRK